MIVIGTRGSKLALVQAHWVRDQLHAHGCEARIEVLKTKGDIVQDRFDKIEGKGFFTKEIEDALREQRIDLAVHCLKDLPTAGEPGLEIAAIPKRESPMDVLIAMRPFEFEPNEPLPNLKGLRIGTSSNRRVHALKSCADQFVPIRGNVPTRLKKLQDGQADVIVLAKAGLNRLKMDLCAFHLFEPTPFWLTPAPGQGALALQVRAGSSLDISFLHDEETAAMVAAERRILQALEGGCQLPLGVLVQPQDDQFRLQLFLSSIAGDSDPVRLDLMGPSPEACADDAMAKLRALRRLT